MLAEWRQGENREKKQVENCLLDQAHLRIPLEIISGLKDNSLRLFGRIF